MPVERRCNGYGGSHSLVGDDLLGFSIFSIALWWVRIEVASLRINSMVLVTAYVTSAFNSVGRFDVIS